LAWRHFVPFSQHKTYGGTTMLVAAKKGEKMTKPFEKEHQWTEVTDSGSGEVFSVCDVCGSIKLVEGKEHPLGWDKCPGFKVPFGALYEACVGFEE
jgi:hypothetical protein